MNESNNNLEEENSQPKGSDTLESYNDSVASTDSEQNYFRALTNELVSEQKRNRRWGIFFKTLFIIYLVFITAIAFFPKISDHDSDVDHVGLVKLAGVISENSDANAETIIEGLEKAFKNAHSKAVILHVNSPGGTPVQAGYIYDAIMELRKKYADKKLYAVVSDLCASGGYYVAAAADEIYADKASIVGSIGVIMDGFGFVDTMKKLGVERRVLAAGEYKALLDPFSPSRQAEIDHVKNEINTIHEQFVTAVKNGRGEKLKGGDELFSGLIWTGEKALTLGLVDALGDERYVARKIVGESEIVDYTPRRDFFENLAQHLGQAIGKPIWESMSSQTPNLLYRN